MTPSARLQSTQDILLAFSQHQNTATNLLRDWGKAHRFAGSKDRTAIASIVYDCLRCWQSAQWQMGADTPRAIILGMLKRVRNMPLSDVQALFSGGQYAPDPLSDAEQEFYSRDFPDGAPLHIAGDFPETLTTSLSDTFGADTIAQMRAMIFRAPLDLRVNSLKGNRPEVLEELVALSPQVLPHTPWGIRIAQNEGRAPSILNEPAFLEGRVEVQDGGAQLLSQLAGAFAGELAIDLCAGGGGKTLALAAMMNNGGKIYASDSDASRLFPIYERLNRAGVNNAQVCMPDMKPDILDGVKGMADLVLVDAPCTGAGTWRRNPEAKSRFKQEHLTNRVKDQARVLDRARELVKPGGHIAYITCSVLKEENDEAIRSFFERFNGFTCLDAKTVLARSHNEDLEKNIRITRFGMMLTPLQTATDGFYLSIMRRDT